MPENNQGITHTDLVLAKDFFLSQGWPLNQHAFRYNIDTDEWEFYRVQGSSGMVQADLIATRDSSGQWNIV